MSPSPAQSPRTTPPDGDLIDQAVPGHGVPSQDPDPQAQSRLNPRKHAKRPNQL